MVRLQFWGFEEWQHPITPRPTLTQSGSACKVSVFGFKNYISYNRVKKKKEILLNNNTKNICIHNECDSQIFRFKITLDELTCY